MNEFEDYTVAELLKFKQMLELDLESLRYDWEVTAPQWRHELMLIEQELLRR